MSSTRRTNSGEFRQERYCSSSEFERGLMANLVAKRCSVIADAADRELIWFLQWRSHQEGGLDSFVSELLAKFPERNATPSMQRFGMKTGQIYKAAQVKAVRAEVCDERNILDGMHVLFPLRGDEVFNLTTESLLDDKPRLRARDDNPVSYRAVDFIKHCREEAMSGLSKHLRELCLNAAIDLRSVYEPGKYYLETETPASPWYFPTLVETIRQHMTERAKAIEAQTVVTTLGAQVYDTLNYCLQGRCLVLLDGKARTGKSFACEHWSLARPGRVRYVQVPSTNDDIGFYRAIAQGLGVSINLNSKAHQLRHRIEEVLHARPEENENGKPTSDLGIIFDEAHYLWPQSNYRDALPCRVNWIMTALVNHNVSVALITTPQFLLTQKAVEKKTCWDSDQFTGRIGHYEKLPDILTDSDLKAVARAFVPHGDAKSIELLVVYANASKKYLAGIDAAVKRARFLAHKDGRDKVTARDIAKAIEQNVLRSDDNLFNAIADAPRRAGKTRNGVAARPLQDAYKSYSEPVQGHGETAEFPVRETGQELTDTRRVSALVGS